MNQMSKASLRECVTFTNVDATHWQVNYNGGASHDVITFTTGGASINGSDVVFM
jgi:hypothetical protein